MRRRNRGVARQERTICDFFHNRAGRHGQRFGAGHGALVFLARRTTAGRWRMARGEARAVAGGAAAMGAVSVAGGDGRAGRRPLCRSAGRRARRRVVDGAQGDRAVGHVLQETLLITGFVFAMMLLVEYLNVLSAGVVLRRLRHGGLGTLAAAAAFGAGPGCLGSFAAVTPYVHGALPFGALVANMIATSSDEAFLMLALSPGRALTLFAVLLVWGVLVGWVVQDAHGALPLLGESRWEFAKVKPVNLAAGLALGLAVYAFGFFGDVNERRMAGESRPPCGRREGLRAFRRGGWFFRILKAAARARILWWSLASRRPCTNGARSQLCCVLKVSPPHVRTHQPPALRVVGPRQAAALRHGSLPGARHAAAQGTAEFSLPPSGRGGVCLFRARRRPAHLRHVCALSPRCTAGWRVRLGVHSR